MFNRHLERWGVFFLLILLGLNACSEKQPESEKQNNQPQGNQATAHTNPEADRQWIEGWYPTQSMQINRAGAAAVVHNDVIYMIGGVDGRSFVKSTEYARIKPDGTLTPWQAGPLLNEARGFIDAVVNNGYIYVVGGGNGPNGKNLLRSAERARINADGSLGPWETEQQQMQTLRRCSKVLAVGDYLYSMGGFAGVLLDTVERARILDDGHLGEWTIEQTHMTIPRYINTVKGINDTLYVFGGHDQVKGVGITDVEWARPEQSGEINRWTTAAPLQVGRYGLTSAKHAHRVYVLGGLTGLEYLDSVETSEIKPDGTLGAWRFTTALSVPRATFNTVSYKDKVYVLGGTNEDRYLNTVEFAVVNEQGDLGFWGTAQDAKNYAAFKAKLKNRKKALPNQGRVLQVQQASMYTYANVRSNLGDIWIAGPKLELSVGDEIQFSKGVSMSNFFSKELQRQFPMILFVGKVQKVN